MISSQFKISYLTMINSLNKIINILNKDLLHLLPYQNLKRSFIVITVQSKMQELLIKKTLLFRMTLLIRFIKSMKEANLMITEAEELLPYKTIKSVRWHPIDRMKTISKRLKSWWKSQMTETQYINMYITSHKKLRKLQSFIYKAHAVKNKILQKSR